MKAFYSDTFVHPLPEQHRFPRAKSRLVRGGRHHTFRNRGEGYCVFNDVAMAIAVRRRDGIIARAAAPSHL